MAWLNDNYLYRRQLSLVSPTDVPVGHPVTVEVPPVLLDNGKAREDLEDLEIVFEDADGEMIVLGRLALWKKEGVMGGLGANDEGEAFTAGGEGATFFSYFAFGGEDASGVAAIEVETDQLVFSLPQPLLAGVEDRSYFLYYGNPDLTEQESRPAASPPEWPITSSHDEGSITYTRPGEHWVAGEATTVHARANLRFFGSKVRIISKVKPQGGVMEVQLDGQDWQSVDLFSPVEQTEAVFVVEDLSHELHELRIRVSAEKNPLSRGDEVNVERVEYAIPIEVLDQGEEVADLVWASFTGGM